MRCQLPKQSDKVWAGDITYIPTADGWRYLAVTIHPCSRSIVGWALADHMRNQLVPDALSRWEEPWTTMKPWRKTKASPEDLLLHLPAANVTEWQERVREETGLAGTQFYAHKKTLEALGRIHREPGTDRILRAESIDDLPDLGEDI